MLVHWDSTVNTVGVLTGLGFIVTTLSLLFTTLQIRHNTKIQRARFLLDALDLFFHDEMIQKTFARLDWNAFRFDAQTTPTSPEALCLDHLLYKLDALGFLLRSQALVPEDISVLTFRVLRVMEHPEIQAYLTYLENLYQDRGVLVAPHQEARWLAQ
jgi:hypothetical protein